LPGGQIGNIAGWQRGFVYELSLLHLSGQGIVSFSQVLWFEEIEFNVVGDFSFSDEICGEHVTFSVFAEQVFIA
jgi:hypothetical protein